MSPKDLYQSQAHCPVCGSNQRGNASVGLSREKEPEYLRALATGLGVTVEAIVEPLSDYACSRCGTVYLDPVLSESVTSQLFLTHAPVHNWGWGRLTKKILGDPPESGKVESLEKFVRRSTGLPRNYLEVGCPFGGFALMWADGEALRKKVTNQQSQNKYHDDVYRRLLKYSVRLEKFGAKISSTLVRFWLQLNNLRPSRRSIQAVDTASVKLFYLAQYSSNRWSYGCRAFGATCTEMALHGMGAEVLSIERLKKLPDDYFELAGIVNSLDHADEPMELLREVTRVSKTTIVAGHRLVEAYLQHRFAFSDESMTHVASLLGLVCEDISVVMDEGARKWFAFRLIKATVENGSDSSRT